MKIALYHNLPSGGARHAMVEMVKGLVVHGHTVDEYCPQAAAVPFLPLDSVVRCPAGFGASPGGVSPC